MGWFRENSIWRCDREAYRLTLQTAISNNKIKDIQLLIDGFERRLVQFYLRLKLRVFLLVEVVTRVVHVDVKGALCRNVNSKRGSLIWPKQQVSLFS